MTKTMDKERFLDWLHDNYGESANCVWPVTVATIALKINSGAFDAPDDRRFEAAKAALTGILAHEEEDVSPEWAAGRAVKQADALLAALGAEVEK